jgi:CheY-like chemotaxis protein
MLDLRQSVAGIEKMLRRLLGAGIDLTLLPASDLWSVRGDPGQIEQVLMNLAVNARDAMPRGGKLTIEVANAIVDDHSARVHADVTAGSYVVLTVSDTGVGMDRETQLRVFEPFFTTKESGKGTGLGLATVFGIVKQSGGHVTVESEPGKGTTFRVYFPRVSGVPDARASEHPAPLSVRVEDDDQVRSLARDVLRRSGYVVLEAPNGGEALLLCEQHRARIDLLLADVILPRMNGYHLAQRLLGMRPEMKVLFMSGSTDDVQRGDIVASGVAYLQKPLTPGTLTRKVWAVLRAGCNSSEESAPSSRM